jgi:hypothetical protein
MDSQHCHLLPLWRAATAGSGNEGWVLMGAGVRVYVCLGVCVSVCGGNLSILFYLYNPIFYLYSFTLFSLTPSIYPLYPQGGTTWSKYGTQETAPSSDHWLVNCPYSLVTTLSFTPFYYLLNLSVF